jgi:methionyl-tRNA formyltransferase
MLLTHLPALKFGLAPRHAQDESAATIMPRRRPEDGRIDWNRDARSLFNWVRALAHPYPGAFTQFEGRKLLVWRAMMGDATGDATHDAGAPAGSLIEGSDGTLHVATGRGTLRLESVQWEGDGEAYAEILRPLVGRRFDTGGRA